MAEDFNFEKWALNYESGLRKAMSNPYFVSQLPLKFIAQPGQYWFFHPGLYNLRWWWEEAISYSKIVRESIVDCLVRFELLKTLEVQHIAHRDETLKVPDGLLNKVAEKLYISIEDGINRLFSFREKISWICYEILSCEFEIKIEENKISYFSIKSELEKLHKAHPNHDLLSQVTLLYEVFCRDDFNELFKFRSGFVHRYRPQLDKKQPNVILYKNGKWDSMVNKEIKTRNLVHLISCCWRLAVDTTLDLARLKVGAVAFKLQESRRKTTLPLFNPVDICHNGYASEFDDFYLYVKCMKDCRGFMFTIQFKTEEYCSEHEKFAQKASEMCDKIINYIPSFEIERYKGEMQILLYPLSNCFEMLVALKFEEHPPETFKDLTKGNFDMPGAVWIHNDLLRKKSVYSMMPDFDGWPEKAIHAFLDAYSGKKTTVKSLKKANSKSKDAQYYILLDEEIINTNGEPMPGRIMAKWTETIDPKK